MTDKITELTPEQTLLMEKRRDEWLAIWGRPHHKANRQNSEASLVEMYKILGFGPPTFHWFDSPPAALEAIGKKKNPKDPLSGARSALGERVDMGWRIGWLAFYLFAEEIGVKFDEDCRYKLGLWEVLAREIHWFWAYDTDCFISEQPTSVHWDAENRLHHPTEPAMAFRDGQSLYVWHGTEVPKEWILESKKMDPQIALSWENIEQRRCAAEIIGWKAVLERLQAKTIDKDYDPMIGELLEVELPDGGPSRFLKVLCGTGRDFVLPVPNAMETALDANAWTYDIKPEELRLLEVRT